MPTVTTKKNDTAPLLTFQALDSAGNPIPLSGTVRFLKKNVLTGALNVGVGATQITDALNGKMSYAPDATDSAVTGTWRCEFEVTFTGGAIETFPERRGNDEILFVVAPGSK